MPSGSTTTDALATALPTVISSARIVREFVGVMPNLADKVTLGEGVGLSWNEVSMQQLTAQSVTESTDLQNPQQISGTLFTVTPTTVGIYTLITDRVAARISKNAYAKLGALAQNAIQRKKDEDGLVVLDGATTSLAGAGSALTSGHISAAVYRILGNATEPAMPPVYFVGHPFQIKDIQDELVKGVAPTTAPQQLVSGGLSEKAYVNAFHQGRIMGAEVYEDGNITVDSSDDAKGGVFAKQAIVLVQGRAPRAETQRRPNIGGGATAMYLYDEYAYGERSPGNWLFEIYSDATAPTS